MLDNPLIPDFTSYPYATADLPPVAGVMRRQASDFQVEEVPCFETDPEGTHLAVLIEKVDMTTPFLAQHLRDELRLGHEDIGWAGLKDRHAVTRQWLSVPRAGTPPPADWVLPEGARLLETRPMKQKLQEGHLAGNKFRILLREPQGSAQDVLAIFLRLGKHGVPNYFGPQRFGNNGRNAEQGLAKARSGRGKPRSFFDKLALNALQSLVFNAWLAKRILADPTGGLMPGDIAHKLATGGKFLVPDPSTEIERLQAFEIVASGPLPGKKYHEAHTEARAFEDLVLGELGLHRQDFVGLPGSRRPAFIPFEDFGVEDATEGLWLRFTLPRGSYATSVLREVFKHHAPHGDRGGEHLPDAAAAAEPAGEAD